MPPRRRPLPALLAAALLATLSAPTVVAQEAPATAERTARRTYAADYFAAAAPANAWDMLQRLPGFVVVEPDADVRGYAGAQGNVLVDGERPASKHEDLAQLLQRIPASAVLQIELIVAGGGVDMGGQSQLANIVRRPDPPAEIAVTAGIAAADDGWAAPLLEVEYGRHADGRALELALSLDAEADEDGGDGWRRTIAADGELLEAADSDERSIVATRDASAHWRQPWAGGQLAVNGALRQERTDYDSRLDFSVPAGGTGRGREDEDFRQVEAGVRWSRPLADDLGLALLASQQLGQLDGHEFEVDEDGDEESFAEDSRSGESLLRAEANWEAAPAWSFAASAELAYNFLDSRTRLLEDGVEVELPNANARVEERRGELGVDANWQPAEDWRVQGGLRVEVSRLRQSGDTELERRFVYPKPRFDVAWEPSGAHTLRWTLAREVGQLDFGDFVAGASLSGGEVAAGNAQLEPDKTWRSTLAWEWEFGDDGGLQLAWIHDDIADVLDRVAVADADGELFDAPGNIGDGRRDGLQLQFGSTLPGLPSVRIDTTVLWQHSRVVDPTTGESRRISGDKPLEGEIALEQVLFDGAFSWGVELTLAERESEYRYDEIKDEGEGKVWEIFAERRFAGGWRLRGELVGLGGRRVDERTDEWGDGGRGNDVFEESEQRRRDAPAMVMLTLRRDIGG